MSKDDTKHKLVPGLRFSEFRDAPAWDHFLLDELEHKGRIELGRGKVISHGDMCANPGPNPVYSSSVIDGGLMGTYGDYLFDEELISWSVDGGGDFFYRPKHKFSVTNVSGFMRVLSEDIVCRFLAYQLERLHASLTFDYQQKAHPSVIRTLYTVGLPEPNEQHCIADCLGSLDDLIAAEGRKLKALRNHKKGLMQQLFPREGETRPRLRFPEFRDAPEWTAKPIGEIAPLQRGFDLPLSEVRDGDVPIVYSNGIRGFHSTSMATAPGLVTGRSGTLGKLHFIESGEYWPHNTALWVTDFCGNFPRFIFYLYGAINFERFSSGSGVPTLNRNDAHAFRTAIPGNQEQQRIADCLASLDATIAAQVEKLDALRTHKRGLMQQLFPSEEGNR